MPPDAKQRALGVLWQLLVALAMVGVGYILCDAQVDSVPTFLVASSWILYCYMFFFPSSSLAVGFVHGFDLLGDNVIKALVVTSVAFLLLHLYRGDPVGMVYLVALGIVDFCNMQLAICGAATEPSQILLCKEPHLDTAAADAAGSGDAHHPTKPDKPVGSQPRVPSVKWKILMTLFAMLALAYAALFAWALIDWSAKDWVLNSAPADIAPFFDAVQANKTTIPIPALNAAFSPTGTFGSPCQAAPMPTPVDKSMWRGIAMSTPMPTPVPAPTPSAVLKPEPVVISDEPIDVLNGLFGFDVPEPKALLKWYFSLPDKSQYTCIFCSLLALSFFSTLLITLAAHLVVLTITYLASAAALSLLLNYGFTPEQSIAILLPADFALIVSIWWAWYCLKNMASMSWGNAAGLAKLGNDFGDLRARDERRWSRLDNWSAVINNTLMEYTKSFRDVNGRLSIHGKRIDLHSFQIMSLILDKAGKADLDKMIRIIDELSGKIDGLETSKGDADLLRASQRGLDELRLMVERIRAEKADAKELEQFQRELKRISRLIDQMDDKKADTEALKDIAGRLDRESKRVAGVLEAQEKLTKSVAALEADMGVVREDVSSLAGTSNLHDSEIQGLKASKKTIENLNSQVRNDRKTSKIQYDECKKENADLKEELAEVRKESAEARKESAEVRKENANLKQDLSKLEGSIPDLLEKVATLEAAQITQKDLQKLREDVASDADQKMSQQADQLRSETKDLRASVDKRFDDEGELTDRKFDEHVDATSKDIETLNTAVTKHVDHVTESIEAANQHASNALERVQDAESQRDDSISRAHVDDYIVNKVAECIDKVMASDIVRSAFNDAQRAQVHELIQETFHTAEFQDQLRASITQSQSATTNLSGDPHGLISEGRADPTGIGHSNSHAAPDNTIGADDPAGDPYGLISGGRSTANGDIPSDNISNPDIPEDSSIPDDIETHHATHGPLGDPPRVISGGHPTALDGRTSAGPSGDGDGTGHRPDGEDNDGTIQPKQQEVGEPCEPDDSTDAQISGQAESQKPEGRMLGDLIKKKNRRKTRKNNAIAKVQAQQLER